MAAKESNTLKIGYLLKGSRFRYRIAKVIGSGSFGITYLAEILNPDGSQTGMLGAVKEFYMRDINVRNEDVVEVIKDHKTFNDYFLNFKKEAVTMSKIDHPNVVKVFESFDANRTAYYSMTFINGGSLDDKIKDQGRLEDEEALKITSKLAVSLFELHLQGLVHFDIKPANILMLNKVEPMLIDFGLAKMFRGERDANFNIAELGTPGYAPLEQAMLKSDDNNIPVTIDVYALGATLYKMLTGKRPPSAAELVRTGLDILELKQAGVSEITIRILQKAMAPTPEYRYQNMAALNDDIEAYLKSRKSGFPFSELPSDNPIIVAVDQDEPISNGFEEPLIIVEPMPVATEAEVNSQKWISETATNKNHDTLKAIIIGVVCFLIVGGVLWYIMYPGFSHHSYPEDDYESDTVQITSQASNYEEQEQDNEPSISTSAKRKQKSSNKSKTGAKSSSQYRVYEDSAAIY